MTETTAGEYVVRTRDHAMESANIPVELWPDFEEMYRGGSLIAAVACYNWL